MTDLNSIVVYVPTHSEFERKVQFMSRQSQTKLHLPLTRSYLSLLLPVFVALVLLAARVSAADPGTLPPATSEINDQKLGSVLIFNLYSSSSSTPNSHNTRFGLTNYSTTTTALLHLFLVDSSGSVADFYICLTPNQTASFLASDVDPGTRGFLIGVVIGNDGCPINFNFLSGTADVKLSSGHAASLQAEAIAAIAATPTTCNAMSSTATLNFDGTNYNRLPRALALDKVRSSGDGNSTLLVLNRIGGNLASAGAPLGMVNGELVDAVAQGFNFTINSSSAQLFSTLSATFPATSPPYTQLIPAGCVGWMNLVSVTDAGMLGAMINFNPNAAVQVNAFNGGRNLRKLTLASMASLIISVFPPVC